MEFNIQELAKGIADNLNHVELIGEDKLKEMIKEDSVDPNEKISKPVAVIQMNGDNGKVYDVITTQNISMTIGAAKSKKTFYSTMMASALLGFKDHGIIGNRRDKDVLFFDTEQSKWHVQRLNYRIKKMVGSLFGFKLFCLRKRTPDERRAMIEYYLKKYQGQYSFVFIDGIVDLIYDFNNQEQCSDIITDLMKWSDIYDCHINVVLHITIGFGNAKGHLGSLLTNKVECVYRVTKEDDQTSKVNCESSRNEAFPAFDFRIDENGIPVRDSMPTAFFNNDPKELPELIDNSAGLEIGDTPF